MNCACLGCRFFEGQTTVCNNETFNRNSLIPKLTLKEREKSFLYHLCWEAVTDGKERSKTILGRDLCT
jgi:hypothetical protein